MYWSNRHDLKFQVHMKPNQKLKYLNSNSSHMPSTFRAILSGVLGWLSKLTSKSKKLDDTPIDEVYSHHSRALKISGIAPNKFPTFKEIGTEQIKYYEEKKVELRKSKDKKRKRNTFFCIGISKCSKKNSKHPPFHAILKTLRDNHNLRWLRISMSYHQCTNLS